MNHVYRVVWSVSKQLWVAASENSCSHTKGGSRGARKLLLASLLSSGLSVPFAFAEDLPTTVVPTGGNTNAYISANGVPIVDINTANSAGLSHNSYTNYNVESNGLVLNNGNASQLSRQSQLAGQVGANFNLKNEATVILNEVVSTNRSTLAGFTEVLGGKADVIVANPNGITCNGCGFINTNRATLTTGTSSINNDGSLSGFTVNGGEVLIEGLGANASTQQIFDLVARSVKIGANINVSPTGSLGLIAGSNEWDYTQRTATKNATANSSVPSFAIDSTALGGMYAGRISIIATEAGVGVRMLGDAAASADDFTLSSEGKIEIHSDVSAQRNASITTTSASGANDLLVDNANLSANRDLTLLAADGEVNLSEGELYAANNLMLTGWTINDISTSENTRYAGADNTFIANYETAPCSGEDCVYIPSIVIDGSVWGAGQAFSGTAERLDVGSSGATLYAGTTLDLTASRNLNLKTAAISSVDDMTLSAGSGIRTLAADTQGIQSTVGNLNLNASVLRNGGTMSADDGTVTARISYYLANTGTLHAGSTLDIADEVGGSSVRIDNEGTIIADGTLNAQAGTFQNRLGGNILSKNGTDITAYSLVNEGTFIVSDTGDQSGTFTLATLDNSGTLQSAGNLNFNVTDTLLNDGELLASNNLSLIAGTSALDINNMASGQIQADNALTITAENATFTTQLGNVLGNTVDLTVASLYNTGRLQSTLDMTIDVMGTTTVQNLGVVHSGGSLNWASGGTLYNDTSAAISALDTLTLTNNNVTNFGALYAGKLFDADTAISFRNLLGGTINSSEDINFSASRLYNNGKIEALRDIDIDTTVYFSNEISGGTPSTTEILAFSYVDTIRNELEQCTFGACTYPSQLWVYENTYTYEQTLRTALPATPEIIAGRDLSIDINAGNGQNFLGLISAFNTLTFDGSGNFTNEAFSLNYVNYKRRYYKHKVDGLGITTAWYYRYADALVFNDSLPTMEGTNNYLTFGENGGWLTATPGSSSSDSTSRLNQNRLAAEFVYAGGETVAQVFPSSIKAKSIGGTLGNLNNLGITYSTDTPTVNNGTSAIGSNPLNDGTGINFNDLNISLPSNPNGFFVESQDSNANYLIETNPLFNVGLNFAGSDYFLDNYGYSPDEKLRRLGDSNYEAYLIRQQLIAQTGSNILEGYGSEADQMKSLMDQAYQENQAASGKAGGGFTFGEALTAKQIASLEKDLVWMVETTVNGERVLTPVVYLASATRSAINTGAVISGESINLDVSSLTNTGGTISGSTSNVITSQGDITNTSGAIKGGDVDLSSSEGSIINQTTVKGQGDSITYNTDIGKTATIESTGSLNLDAKKDIEVIGAKVTAGGDAVIHAGENIKVDTIVDKTVTTTGSSRETTHGYETTNTNTLTETNIGSAISVGGTASIIAEKEMSIRGSDVDVVGEAHIEGKEGLKIKDAVDKERKTVITETSETFGSGSEGEAHSGSHSESESGTGTIFAQAKASAEAEAEASGTADFKIGETTRTVTTSGSNTSVSSNINVGSGLTLKTDSTLTVQGSNVESGGDLSLNAENVEVLAGQNETWSDTKTERSSIGIYTEGDAEAGANAEANASAGSAGLGADSNTGAGSSSEAEGVVTFGARTETEHSTSYKLTNTGSSLKSGGNMTVTATEEAKFVGADVESTGSMTIDAKNITNEAAKDLENTTYSKTTETVGIYLDASVGAETESRANANTGLVNNAGGGAEGGVEGEVGAGIRYHTKTESNTSDTTTHVGNTFKSGGDFTRTAKDTIIDQGTEVDAGGNFTQKARVIEDQAIHDVTTTTSESSEHDVRVGVYAGGSAEASAEGDAAPIGRTATGTGSDAEAGAGFSAKYEMNESSATSENKTAVTSKFKSGGSISSVSTEKTTLVGAQFESVGDTTIEAKELDYQAAQDSSTSSSSSNEVGAELKASVYGSTGVKAEAEYAHETKSSGSTTAKAGSVNAGGNLTIKTSGDTTLVGTSLEAGNTATIDSGGTVDFQAAKDTSSSSESTVGVSASFSKTTKNKGKDAGVEGSHTVESSETAVVGNIKSGSGGTSIKSTGANVLLEGTNLDSTGATSVEAAGAVKLEAAESSSVSGTIGGSVEAMKHEEGPGLYQGGEGEGGSALSASRTSTVESTITNINSDGGVKIKAGVIVNQEAELNSDVGAVTLTGTEIKSEASNSNISIGDSIEYKTEASLGE